MMIGPFVVLHQDRVTGKDVAITSRGMPATGSRTPTFTEKNARAVAKRFGGAVVEFRDYLALKNDGGVALR